MSTYSGSWVPSGEPGTIMPDSNVLAKPSDKRIDLPRSNGTKVDLTPNASMFSYETSTVATEQVSNRIVTKDWQVLLAVLVFGPSCTDRRTPPKEADLQYMVTKLSQLAIKHEYVLNSIKRDTSLYVFVKPGSEGLIPILFATSEKWHKTQQETPHLVDAWLRVVLFQALLIELGNRLLTASNSEETMQSAKELAENGMGPDGGEAQGGSPYAHQVHQAIWWPMWASQSQMPLISSNSTVTYSWLFLVLHIRAFVDEWGQRSSRQHITRTPETIFLELIHFTDLEAIIHVPIRAGNTVPYFTAAYQIKVKLVVWSLIPAVTLSCGSLGMSFLSVGYDWFFSWTLWRMQAQDMTGTASLRTPQPRRRCADAVEGGGRSSCLGANACDRVWCSLDGTVTTDMCIFFCILSAELYLLENMPHNKESAVRRAKKRKTGQVRGSVLNPKNENSSGRPQGEFGLLEAEFGLLLRQAEDGPGPGGPGGPATGTTGGAGVATRSEEPGSDRFRSRDEDDEEPGRPRRCSRRVVDPQHPGKAVWDVGISIMIVYSVLVEPFRIGFGVEVSGAMLAIDIFVDCLFVIDIVLTFFTAYLDEREVLVTNRLRIAQRYLRGFFVIDVASVFPAELFLLAIQPDIATQARAVKLLRLVRLMKLGRLFKLKRLVLLVEEKLNFSLQVMDMLKMLVKVLFIVHWLACLTFLVASPVCADGTAMPCPPPESPNDDTRFWSNWVRMFQVDKFDLACGPQAVGYGDIFPANSFERIVCIVSQITGAVLFGFLLSCITAVLEFTHPRELEHKKRMSEIKVPGTISSLQEDEHTMLLSLPTHLRSQLVESSQKTYFQAIQAATVTGEEGQASLGNFEKGLVAELAVQVMPMQVPYHMCILETGELTTELYVVVTGRVEAVLVEERHNENPEQLEAFLKLCLASSDPRRNGGGVAREDLFDEPSGNSLPDASADGEEARPRAERTRRRQATPTRGLIQRARSFLTEDIIQILCGIYGELEAFGHCAVAPLRFRGGCYQSEIFSISQDILDRAMSAYPGRQQEFEVRAFAENRQDL
ncbi:unnamed protein product [Symbiodinium microadriaticum]|nr:unnamed protein product [Symbiodinium microadriaticum]